MGDVQLRHLSALRAVALEGSFGRAGQRLGYTQSAISQQIAALERAIGATVFDRPGGPRPVELTPAGRLLLDHAEAILDRLDDVAAELARLQAGEAGHLLVGTFQSASAKLLPHIVGRLRQERPGIEIRLLETDDLDSLAARTVAGELDVTFLVHDGPDDRLDIVEVCEDPYVVLAPVGHPLAASGTVAVEDLAGAPLIGQADSVCQVLIDRNLRRFGVDPGYVFRSNDNGAVQAMVRAGMGMAVLPYLAIDPQDPGVRVLEPEPPLPPRTVAVATRARRTISPAVRRFVELACVVGAEVAPPPGARPGSVSSPAVPDPAVPSGR